MPSAAYASCTLVLVCVNVLRHKSVSRVVGLVARLIKPSQSVRLAQSPVDGTHETLSGRASEVAYSLGLLPAAGEGSRHRPSHRGQGVTPVRARGLGAAKA